MGMQFDPGKMIARALREGNSGAITLTEGACEGFFWPNPEGDECRFVCGVPILIPDRLLGA